MWKITLSDGTCLEGSRTNSSYYIADTAVHPEAFQNKLEMVTIEDSMGSHTHGPMELVSITQEPDGWYILLREITASELQQRELSRKTRLQEQKIQALTDQNQFLEDCIAEMAGVVYA